MAWVFLICAGLLETVWASFMKKSVGFTLLAPTAMTIISMIASVALLSVSMKTLPLGTAYAVWTGIGAVGAFVVGIALLGEAATLMRFIAATLIVAGIMLMKFSSPTKVWLRWPPAYVGQTFKLKYSRRTCRKVNCPHVLA